MLADALHKLGDLGRKRRRRRKGGRGIRAAMRAARLLWGSVHLQHGLNGIELNVRRRVVLHGSSSVLWRCIDCERRRKEGETGVMPGWRLAHGAHRRLPLRRRGAKAGR